MPPRPPLNMLDNWEEERKIVDGLGSLYPNQNPFNPYNRCWDDTWKAWWIIDYCVYTFRSRIIQLENYVKHFAQDDEWVVYYRYFLDKKCGKKN